MRLKFKIYLFTVVMCDFYVFNMDPEQMFFESYDGLIIAIKEKANDLKYTVT